MAFPGNLSIIRVSISQIMSWPCNCEFSWALMINNDFLDLFLVQMPESIKKLHISHKNCWPVIAVNHSCLNFLAANTTNCQ
jgi:hypothetical protein